MKRSSPISMIFMFLVLLIGLGVGVFTISQKGGQFDVRKRASQGLGIATLTLQTSATTRYVGDIFKLDIMINTGGKKISGAAFRLVFPYTASSPILEVVDDDTATAGIQITSHANTLGNGMGTTVNIAQAQPSGKMYVDLAIVTSDPNGFTSDVNGQKFATITFKAKKVGVINIDHDADASKITDKDTGLDILRTIPTFTITMVADTQKPSVTITDGPSEGSISTSSAVTFKWKGTDLPERPADTAVDLKYQYQFDTTASTYISDIFVTKTLTHGQHTFKVRAKDISNNEGAFTAVRTFKLDLTPKITSVTPDGGNVGTVVTIKGYNFGPTKATIKFGGTTAASTDITSWTDTQIVVKVPAAAKDTIVITTTAYGATLTSNTAAFNVGTAITLVVKLQGIPGQSADKTATLVVRRGTTEVQRFENKTLSWSDVNSAYSVTAVFSSDIPTANDYTVSIKEGSRLRKKFTGVSLTMAIENKRVKTADADKLLIGDLNNDNKLTISDFGALMTNFTSTTGLTVPVTAAIAKYDLNGDNNLSILDIGLLLANYTALEKSGDAE